MNLVLLLALFTGDSMTVQAGQVIVIKSDVPAAWAVYPSDWPYFNVDETFVAGAGLISREITVYKSTTKDGKPAIDATAVKIVGPDGPPGPKPDPDPPSDEPLAKQVARWLATVPADAKGNAAAIAEVMVNTAKAENNYSTVEEMASGMNASIRLVVDDPAAWKGFGMQLTAYVAKQDAKTPKELAVVLKAIAAAMTTN